MKNIPQPKSDYVYKIDKKAEPHILVISDLDKGKMSVTNDMDAVIANIVATEGANFNISKSEVIYRDSSGVYDKVITSTGKMCKFSQIIAGIVIRKEEEAIRAIRNQ